MVMALGKVPPRKARPTRAGLNRLYPSPPQINLPRPMDTAPPIKAIHKGKAGGKVRPSSRPVRRPLPSSSRSVRCCIGEKAHSVSMAPAILASNTRTAPSPKNQMPARVAGSRA